MKVEFYYWPECSSHEDAYKRLEKVLKEEGVDAEVERIIVTTEEDAEKFRFSGSPTIFIGGNDIDPEGAKTQQSRLTCRIYQWSDGRISPLPSEDMIRDALRNYKHSGQF